MYNYWTSYAADGAGASAAANAHAGTYGSVVNLTWTYCGGHYGDPSYAIGAAEYDGKRKRRASASDPYDSERAVKRQSYVCDAVTGRILARLLSDCAL